MGIDPSADFEVYFCFDYPDRVIYNLLGPCPDSLFSRLHEAMGTGHDGDHPSFLVDPHLSLWSGCKSSQ